jgi:small subunit ribosomal protein S20
MANTASAEKRARQALRRNAANRASRSRVSSSLKNLRAAISAGNKESAAKLLPLVTAVIDKAVKSGRVHPNKANRHKSTLTLAVASLNQAAPEKAE